ncbi:MAG: ABC transporter permease [Bryobacteraceae bacterium]
MRLGKFPSLALAILAVCYGSALFAGFVAPYSFETQNRESSYVSPTRLHFFDRSGRIHWRPFIYPSRARPDGAAEYEEDQTSTYPISFLVVGEEYNVIGILPARVHLFGVDKPARIFLLGTDVFGRDVFSRLVYGGQISLIASLAAALVSVMLGVILGSISGFYAHWTDAIVMRLTDVFLAMPWLYLLLAVRAALPLHIDSRQSYLFLAILIGLVGWARPARLARGIVLSAKEAEYVLAARSFGASDGYLFRRHIFPSLWGMLLTQLAIYIPQYILAEVTLSFLGLGVSEPMASWGNMLGDLQIFVSDRHWWLFSPAFLLFGVLLAYHGLFAFIKKRTL